MPNFDAIDRKILTLLQDNDRLALAELSTATGVAASTVNDRIKRLLRKGVITGFHAHLSPEALDLDLLAFMLVGWSDPKVERLFLAKIRKSPPVLECHHITRAWNYLLKVRVKNTRGLESFIAEIVKSVKGVERTETLIAMSTAKETWTIEASR